MVTEKKGLNQALRHTSRVLKEKALGVIRPKKVTLDTAPIRVVVTGIEHSGTTLMSTLLRQAPGLDCGFECGLLLASTPQEFRFVEPWYGWMKEPVEDYQWGMAVDDLAQVCSSRSWMEAYQKILELSPVFTGQGPQQIIDKTPRYLQHLDTVLSKIPPVIPCFVVEKRVENLWKSHRKRGATLESFEVNYRRYNSGLRAALKVKGEQVHRVSYERLCTHLEDELKKMFRIVELPYCEEYLLNHRARLSKYYEGVVAVEQRFSEDERSCFDRLRAEFRDLEIG